MAADDVWRKELEMAVIIKLNIALCLSYVVGTCSQPACLSSQYTSRMLELSDGYHVMRMTLWRGGQAAFITK